MNVRATLERLTTHARQTWLTYLVAALCAAVLVPAAQARLIDGDEGFYLIAARLVSEGKRLYADFFYPQMPLLPHVYGGWFTLFGRGWMSARLFTAIIAVGVALLVFELARRATGRRRWGALATFLFVANGMTLGWGTIAKTYALTSLFLMAGALALGSARRWAPAIAGLCLGLATDVRLYVVVAFLPAVVWLSTEPGPWRERFRRVGLLTVGGLVAAIPALVPLLRDAESFWFGVLGFHRIREAGQTEFVGDLPQKWATLLSVLGIRAPEDAAGLQMLALVTAALAALFARRSSPTTYLWWPLFLISLVPTPTYTQYFVLMVPMLAVEAARFGAALKGATLAPAVAMAVAFYALVGAQDGQRYLRTGKDVPGVLAPDRVPRWTVATMKKVTAKLNQQPVEEGTSWWPGYFVGSRVRIIPEMANDFGTRSAGTLTPEQRKRLRLVSHADVAAMMRERRPRLYLEGNWFYGPVSAGLPAAGYRDIGTVENVRFWLAP